MRTEGIRAGGGYPGAQPERRFGTWGNHRVMSTLCHLSFVAGKNRIILQSMPWYLGVIMGHVSPLRPTHAQPPKQDRQCFGLSGIIN